MASNRPFLYEKMKRRKNMKTYVEVNEEKCSEVNNCMCTKEFDGKTYCRGCGNVQPEREK